MARSAAICWSTPTGRGGALTRSTRARKAGRDPGALAGLPLGVKDIFCTRGVETTCASKILKGFVPPYESTVTARLAGAGAVMLGKLNMDEFAMGSSNENSAFKPVRNPWSLRPRAGRIVGGLGGGDRGVAVRGRDRHRHGRFDPTAGRALRRRRRQADLRARLALRRDRVRVVARSPRAVRAHRRGFRGARSR